VDIKPHVQLTSDYDYSNMSCFIYRLLLWLHLIHLDLQLHLLAERCSDSNQRAIHRRNGLSRPILQFSELLEAPEVI